MKPSTAYLLGGIIFVVCVVVAVYYLIPGISHVFATPATGTHIKHAIVFFVVGIVALIGARFAANSRAAS